MYTPNITFSRLTTFNKLRRSSSKLQTPCKENMLFVLVDWCDGQRATDIVIVLAADEPRSSEWIAGPSGNGM